MGHPEYPSGHRQRLKERLLRGKRDALPDVEILELILYSAYHRIDIKPIARSLMQYFGSFGKIFAATPEELKNVQGVGNSAVAAIFAVKEALDRVLREEIKQLPVINNWKKLIDYLKTSIGHNSTENFRILYLNKKNNLLSDELQDIGTIDQTPLYVREVIKKTLALSATSIIICHNHPSGDPSPSGADLTITKQLFQACHSMNITLIDHIIVTSRGHYSFKSNGLL